MPESRTALLCWASLVVTLACGRNPRPEVAGSPPAPGTAGSDTVVAQGVISVAGSEPVTILTLRPDTGSSSYRLTGDLAAELRRLAGARVEVKGTPGDQGSWKNIEVSDYTVLAVDGRRPLVGVLAGTGGTLWLRGEDSLALADPDGRLSSLLGAKMWVLPDTSTRPAGVQSYGVLRDPGE